MRFFPAFFGALLITIAVFLFMQSLIQRGEEESVQIAIHHNVEIFRQKPEEEEPEQEEDAPQEPTEEPAMEALEVTPTAPEPVAELDMPALDLSVGDLNIRTAGKSWSAPLGAGGVGFSGGGVDAQGFVEVVPFNTRKPNVPEVAWQNKIDGWVLVAFSVTPEGRTRNIRVLDASPRGVFEEKVVAAVEDWYYQVNFSSKMKGNVLLTQKVEVLWQNYPRNLPNVD